ITEGLASSCCAIVDMGAFESGAVSPAAVCGRGTTKLGNATTTSNSVILTIHCVGASKTRVCSGAASLFAKEHKLHGQVVSVSGKRKSGQRIVKVRVGHKPFTLHVGQTLKLSIRLNAEGRALLRHFHKLPVELVVTVNSANGKRTLPTRRP